MRLLLTVVTLALGGVLATAAGLERSSTPNADLVPPHQVTEGRPAAARTSYSRSPGVLRSGAKAPDVTHSHFNPVPQSRKASYNALSPHWPQIRTMVTDFRTGHLSNVSQRAEERAWTAAHFDFVMSGDARVYKSLNPAIRVIPYALDWNVMQPGEQKSIGLAGSYYNDMQQWFDAHPQYQLERAFLHTAGADPTRETRLAFAAWGTRRWAINPGDAGARAYVADRIRRFVGDADGVFLDSHSSGDLAKALGKAPIAEYPDRQAYQRDMVDYVKNIAAAIAPKIVMINTSEYMRPFDFAMATAAGAAHLERVNNPLSEAMPDRWNWVDSLLAHNIQVELVTLDSWDEANSGHGLFATYVPGNYGSKAERLKMFELASYYMVVPQSPDRLFLDLQAAWKVPFEKVWLKAQEYPVGHPTEPRRVIQKGVDSTGTGFKIFARNFDHALVLVRPTGTWKNKVYGDNTAVTVPVPDGQALRPLHGDGTLGAPVTSVTLRNSEAMILVR